MNYREKNVIVSTMSNNFFCLMFIHQRKKKDKIREKIAVRESREEWVARNWVEDISYDPSARLYCESSRDGSRHHSSLALQQLQQPSDQRSYLTSLAPRTTRSLPRTTRSKSDPSARDAVETVVTLRRLRKMLRWKSKDKSSSKSSSGSQGGKKKRKFGGREGERPLWDVARLFNSFFS